MPEFYGATELGRTKVLYEAIRFWAEGRDDVTLIGGWAVYELVQPGLAMQSRDVDISLHSEGALRDLLTRLDGWGLTLRRSGRRTFPDAHFKEEGPETFRLDIFCSTPNPLWRETFGTQGGANIKPVPQGSVADLGWMIHDKLATVTRRTGADAADKRAKDLLDLYHLVFHNRGAERASELRGQVDDPVATKAQAFIEAAAEVRPEFRDEFETLARWLERNP